MDSWLVLGAHWRWKETALWTRKLRFSIKVNIYLKPCIHIKPENVQLENEDVAGKNLQPYSSKWENGQRMNWPPPKKYNPPS